jgi:hypothetical protein
MRPNGTRGRGQIFEPGERLTSAGMLAQRRDERGEIIADIHRHLGFAKHTPHRTR